ncbi:MAG TPA: ester cyclase [Trebonia sp.]|nr:ester cyclase [Trebonia sp.]
MMAEVGTSGTTEVRARVEALLRAFNEHDIDKVIALHTPDAVLEAPAVPGAVTGRAAIAGVFTSMLRMLPDLQFIMDELEVYLSDSGRVAARWHFTGTMTGPLEPPGYAPTGKKASVTGVCLYEFHDGLIARHAIVYDSLGMLQQVGVMPATDSTQARLLVVLQRTMARAAQAVRR